MNFRLFVQGLAEQFTLQRRQLTPALITESRRRIFGSGAAGGTAGILKFAPQAEQKLASTLFAAPQLPQRPGREEHSRPLCARCARRLSSTHLQ
mgnify:CR=1 FL=1